MSDSIQIAKNIYRIKDQAKDFDYLLVAVSKTKPESLLKEAYDLGVRDFGENKVQEIVPKHENLPKDIHWHFIGHLQRNKVKSIVPFVHLIHSVDSLRLLNEINKQGEKINRKINCLLQVHIASEDTKFGFDEAELEEIFKEHLKPLNFVSIKGLMGMATFTDDQNKIRAEFAGLKTTFDKLKEQYQEYNKDLIYISMGMSNDFSIALEEGSNMIRLGSTIFGARH